MSLEELRGRYTLRSVYDNMLHTTTRIHASSTNNHSLGEITGTGFNFLYESRKYLVTCRHIIEESREPERQDGTLLERETVFRENLNLIYPRKSGNERILDRIEFDITLREENYCCHPDPQVDIAVIDLEPCIDDFDNVFMMKGTPMSFPSDPNRLDALEDIVFVGYPEGLIDRLNIVPLFRKGSTATPYFIDFESLPMFLIDATSVPGSSGSPVFLVDKNPVYQRNKDISISPRLWFLGILGESYRSRDGTNWLNLGKVFKPQTIVETIEAGGLLER